MDNNTSIINLKPKIKLLEKDEDKYHEYNIQ